MDATATLTCSEAAKLKRVHVKEVQQWIRAGRLPAEKLKTPGLAPGEKFFIKRADLDRFLKDGAEWVLCDAAGVERLSRIKSTLAEFEKSLRAAGKSEATIKTYRRTIRRFLKHIGNEPLERVSEELARSFFAPMDTENRNQHACVINQFLQFAVARMPAPVSHLLQREPWGLDRQPSRHLPGPEPVKDSKEVALHQVWSLDRLAEQKKADEDLIAKLARKVIDHYLYFQGRLSGGPDNLDDLTRFADECRELIQSNLPLFMKLSAEGRNVHSVIDERMQR